MTVTQLKHLVVFPSYFWGHARPLSTLAARMVKLRPVTITFLVLTSLHARVEAEVSRDFQPGEEHLASRIRVIGLEEGSEPEHTSGAPGAFEAVWDKLWHGQPIMCAKTGKRYEALPTRPCAAVLDFFAADAYDEVRKTSGDAVKLYIWFAVVTSCYFNLLDKDRLPDIKAEVERTGKPFYDVAYEMLWSIDGKSIYHSPCLPSTYNYEMHPQERPSPKTVFGALIPRIPGNMHRSDGILTFDAADYHPEATTAFRQHFVEKSSKAIYAGPLVPSGTHAVSAERSYSQQGGEIMAFLDEKLKSVGERSVLYVSFGSLFWPSEPGKVWAVLEVLMEKNVPFIMSHGASMAVPIPDDVKARIQKYGNAIVSDWVPQQALLDHSATGWFLMHGGHNGTIEAVVAGVPMIVWPIDADQPANALYLSELANVAYELIEVRSGCGLGKIYRNGRVPIGTVDAVKEEMRGVLDRAFGGDGEEKRARLQVIRKKLQAAWGEDGVARREVAAFLDGI